MKLLNRALLGWCRLSSCRIVHFLHIGKTGGNAIRSALGVKKNEFKKISNKLVVGTRNHNISVDNIPVGSKIIFTLRDPVTRFVSGFNSRLRQGGYKRIPWSDGELRAFSQFKTPNELALALSDRHPSVRTAAVTAMNNIEHVRRPYACWLKNADYLRHRAGDILFVAMIETLYEDFEKIRSLLRLPPEMQLPLDPHSAHKTPDHMDTQLDPEARGNIAAWYSQDYEFIALCRKLGFRDPKELHS